MSEYLSVNIDITLKDKDMSISEVFDFTEALSDLSRFDAEYVFKFCLSVLLDQDAYSKEEIKEATLIISELTNHEDGFNITSKEA